MSDYITIEELKETLELDGLTYADPDIRDSISAASSAINTKCGRLFTTGTAGEIRYFTAYDWDRIEVGDIQSVSQLASDYDGDGTYETVWDPTWYVLEPANAPAVPEPYGEIRILLTKTGNRFPYWPNAVRVTGTFGWASVPPDVKVACKLIAIQFLRRVRDAPFGVQSFGHEGAMSVLRKEDPHIELLLSKYAISGKVMAA